MKRAVFRILSVCAGLWALSSPAAPATTQTSAGPMAFADGVKAILSLTYDGMSRDSLSKVTAWPAIVRSGRNGATFSMTSCRKPRL